MVLTYPDGTCILRNVVKFSASASVWSQNRRIDNDAAKDRWKCHERGGAGIKSPPTQNFLRCCCSSESLLVPPLEQLPDFPPSSSSRAVSCVIGVPSSSSLSPGLQRFHAVQSIVSQFIKQQSKTRVVAQERRRQRAPTALKPYQTEKASDLDKCNGGQRSLQECVWGGFLSRVCVFVRF